MLLQFLSRRWEYCVVPLFAYSHFPTAGAETVAGESETSMMCTTAKNARKRNVCFIMGFDPSLVIEFHILEFEIPYSVHFQMALFQPRFRCFCTFTDLIGARGHRLAWGDPSKIRYKCKKLRSATHHVWTVKRPKSKIWPTELGSNWEGTKKQMLEEWCCALFYGNRSRFVPFRHNDISEQPRYSRVLYILE